MSLHAASTAIGGLYCNVSAFAPNVREFWLTEVVPFKMTFGYEPTSIRVAHGAYSTISKANPIAVFVNARNPIERLMTDEVARIFSTGGGRGDITSWGKLGLRGDWANRRIHPIGPSATAGNIQGVAIFMKQFHFGNHPYAPQYEEAWTTSDIIKRVGEEPSSIGFASFDGFAGRSTPDVKIVAVAEKKGGHYSKASSEDVLAGRYPYLRDAYFYVNRAPGKPLDPFVREYLRMVLSKEGQEPSPIRRPASRR
jgi:phosphate transport system substrate-binding protein